MNKFLKYILLFLAVIIAFIVRLYMFGEAPKGLYLDEAAQGYSAYSILKTGKDEFGKSFPVIFRSFNDFKTPIYIYLIVPFIPIFELTKFTVRFPSLLFSLLTLPFLYLLVKSISPKKIGEWLGVLSILFLAISPWHILFARTNFEVNVSVFFLVAGLFFFYKAIGFKLGKLHKARPWLIVLSAFLLAIAIPAYHSQRIVTPLIIIVLIIRFRKRLLDAKFAIPLFTAIVLGLLITLPTLMVANTPGFLSRATTLNIFAKPVPAGFIESTESFISPIINNRYLLSTKDFSALYLSYFSPKNMFVLGDSGPRSSFPYLATFFLWQFPFMFYGLYILLTRKELGELRLLLIIYLLISPIPAALTGDPYTTIRSLNLLIPQLIVTSLGIICFYQHVNSRISSSTKKQILKISSIIAGVIIILYSITKLYSSVIILNEYYRAKYWNYGWEQVAKTIKQFDPNLPVVVDNSRGEPYSQLLFFLKYDPVKYQNDNFEVPLEEYYTNLNRNTEKHIGNITTRPIDWERDLLIEQYLVGDHLSISDDQISEHNLEIIDEIFYPDNSLAFRIVKTNPEFKRQQEAN